MLRFSLIKVILLTYCYTSTAITIPGLSSPRLVERQEATSTSTRVPDAACTNGPRSRNCWSSGFSVATDFDAKAPPAGKTVTVRMIDFTLFILC